MLQALLNNKFPDINIWKEDLKTSTVLGNLIYLPSFIIYKILKRACVIKTPQNVENYVHIRFGLNIVLMMKVLLTVDTWNQM